jgi:hypothetical protein
MRRLGDESGQTLVMVALSMAVLLGFAAFATDIGVMLHEKRQAQSAADSAAIAAAWALSENTSTKDAGTAAATRYGYTAGTDANGYATTVDIEPKPIDGQFAGQSGYVEAIITRQVPTFFMHVFGWDSATVGARAVATDKGTSDGCFNSLASSGIGVELQGSFVFDAPGCAVKIDSSSSNALNFTGNGGTLTAASVGVVGNYSGLHDGESSPIDTGAAPFSDPLAGKFSPPTFDSSTCTNVTTVTSQPTLTNGVACLQNLTGNITLSNVNLNPGTYVFNTPKGYVDFTGTVGTNSTSTTDPVTGVTTTTGVTLYLTGGMMEEPGTTLNLIAPHNTGGAYDDILIYGAPTDVIPNAKKNDICMTGNGNNGPQPGVLLLDMGNSSGTFQGEIYAPYADLVFQDSGGGLNVVTDVVVNTMCNKTAALTINSYAKNVGGGRFPRISLVE